MNPRFAALMLCAVLAACGGDSNPSTPSLPPVTQPPQPNFSGTYSGLATVTVFNAGTAQTQARVTVTHTPGGNIITLSDTTLTGALNTVITTSGPASLEAGTFVGRRSYQSTGCGVVNLLTESRFAGTFMNYHSSFIPTGGQQGCQQIEIRGELSR